MLKPNIRSLSISSQESYSAVMIADLVAEVPVSIETTDHGSAKPAKEETNLGYDGQLDGGAKSLTVDGTGSTNSHVTNGGGITKGVILNAVQFGQPDSKTKSDEKTATLPIPSLTQQISETKGFKDMSFPRKIAFGVSFLPSILFVLCFSIILPCNLPSQCVEELWIRTFNNTEAISRLEIPENLMFTAAVKGNKSVLLELHKYSGIDMRTLNFDTNSAYLTCGKIINATRRDCLIMDEEGKFFSISDSHSKFVWNPISENEQPSNPVILSDCNGDGVEEVALVVSNTKIKIMYSGTTASTLEISDCDSFPTNLTPWAVNGSSEIVFICKKDGKDKLVKVPKNMWCPYSENSQKEALILHTGTMDSLNKAMLLPVEDGLVLWSEHDASMIQPNGSLLWKASNVSNSEENGYILYGNFDGENKQVALLSSSIASGLKVILLDPSDGNQTKSFYFSDSEANDVVTVHGKKKDFIMILKKKVKQSTDIMTTALTQINDISTTIVSLASNEEVRRVTIKPTSQEVAILNMKGELLTVKELKDLQDADYKTTMTAVYDEGVDVLHIYLLSTSENNASEKTTKVRNINIADWNKSKKSRCLGKVIEN